MNIPGFDINPKVNPIGFEFGPDCLSPPIERRTLNSIRWSLRDPGCSGPEVVYAIAMDIGKREHYSLLTEKNLLYGAVIFSTGRMGNEPVRSQGHVHAISNQSGCSTPEVCEVWKGKAIFYMQETANDDPGRCFAVHAGPGEVVIIPPGWAHSTINSDPDKVMVMGAWAVRDYEYNYKGVQTHQGLSWFPVFGADGRIRWEHNDRYKHQDLTEKTPSPHHRFSIEKGVSIYEQFERDPDRFLFVNDPQREKDHWAGFIP